MDNQELKKAQEELEKEKPMVPTKAPVITNEEEANAVSGILKRLRHYRKTVTAVSYTHLTLPTKRIV